MHYNGRRWFSYIESIFNLHHIAYYFTYSEWAFTLWWTLAVGICLAYGRWYEMTLPMRVFLWSSWLLVVVFCSAWRRTKKREFIYVNKTGAPIIHGGKVWSIQVLGVILCMVMTIGIGYMRTESVIMEYKGRDLSYQGLQAVYVVHLISRPEVSQSNGGTTWRVQGEVLGYFEDAKHSEDGPVEIGHFIPASGGIQLYVTPQEQHGSNEKHNSAGQDNSKGKRNLHSEPKITETGGTDKARHAGSDFDQLVSGSYILVRGKVQPARYFPEEGRIDMRARYISSGRIGTIYDGQYMGVLGSSDLSHIRGADITWYTNSFDSLQLVLGGVHESMRSVLQQYVSLPMSYLSESLLLGGSYGVLDEDIILAFSKTGLIHILSVSGSHIALLFSFIYFIGRICKISRLRATYSAMAIVLIYCALVGYNPPVIRSALMGLVMGLGIIMKRDYVSLQALHISAFILLLYDPMQLFDISFQLSFGATYGIMLFARSMYQSLPKGMPYVWGPVSLCVCAQLLILPFQLYYFHMLGLGSLVAAIVVAPLLDFGIVAILGLLLITGILSLVGLGGMVSFLWQVVEAILQLALFLNETIATMPGLVYWSAALSLVHWLSYGLLIYVLYYLMYERNYRSFVKEYVVYIALLTVLCSANWGLWEENHIQIHTIPLARGGATLVMKRTRFAKAEGLLYVDFSKKAVSPSSRASIVNACHYYGITKPVAIIIKDNVGDILFSDNTEMLRLLLELKYDAIAPVNRLTANVWEFGHSEVFNDVLLDKTDVLHVVGKRKSYVFSHRQTGKKTLKLDEDKLTILSTNDSSLVLTMEEKEYIAGIIYSPSFRGGCDIDPADEKVYMTGTYIIPDFLL